MIPPTACDLEASDILLCSYLNQNLCQFTKTTAYLMKRLRTIIYEIPPDGHLLRYCAIRLNCNDYLFKILFHTWQRLDLLTKKKMEQCHLHTLFHFSWKVGYCYTNTLYKYVYSFYFAKRYTYLRLLWVQFLINAPWNKNM